MNPSSYLTDPVLQQYLLFHYGNPEDQLPWEFGPREARDFPVRCVVEGIDRARLPSTRRGLEVGCAVGRATFEMAAIFEETIGIDYSDVFIEAAHGIDKQGSLQYRIQETGTIMKDLEAHRPLQAVGSIQFEQGDAQQLRGDLGKFDCLLAANLLCRLQRPVEFLRRLPALLRPDAQLVLTTPNTWLETFTARQYWLGATPETGEPLEALKKELEAHFLLDKVWDMPFLIREHRRKYQWSVAQATRWIRRAKS